MSTRRLYFACDIHGSERCFRKLLRTPEFYGVDSVVVGGDLTAKFLAPIERNGAGWVGFFSGRRYDLATANEVNTFRTRAKVTGSYPIEVDSGGIAQLEGDAGFFEETFAKVMVDEVTRWIDMAIDELSGRGAKLYLIAGNDDPWLIDPILERVVEPIVCLEDRITPIGDGLVALGYGPTTPTPWNTPREKSEDEVAADLEAIMAGIPEVPSVWIVHCPPYGSGLDNAFKLKADLSAQANLVPVGSHAVQAAIERYQPMVSLHGHIHESRGAAKIGRTLALNPGSEYADGTLRGALVVLKKGQVKGYQLVTG